MTDECAFPTCTNPTTRIVCARHWPTLPEGIQIDIDNATEIELPGIAERVDRYYAIRIRLHELAS